MKKYWLALGLLPLAILDYYLGYCAAFYIWMTAYYTDQANVRLAQKYLTMYASAFTVVSILMAVITIHVVRIYLKAKRGAEHGSIG